MPIPSSLPPISPAGTAVQTGFKDWAGSPPHLFGQFVGRPWQPWAFDEVYATTGLVIVRDDIFEGTVGVPISFKTHNPGQAVGAFTLSQLISQSLASTGTPYDAIMNGLMLGVSGHSDFIIGTRCYYNTWRIRAVNRFRTSGTLATTVFAGEGVGPSGLGLTMFNGFNYINAGPTYVLNVSVNANLPPGTVFADKNFQVEVGFGGTAQALASASVLTATPEWPAYTQPINATDV